MVQKFNKDFPRYTDLIVPVFQALKELGGSGSNDEILTCVMNNLKLSDDVVDLLHKGSTSTTELAYQLMWARTYLKNYGVIENSARSVWAILPEYAQTATLDAKLIVQTVAKRNAEKRQKQNITSVTLNNSIPEDDGVDGPEEIEPWRQRLLEILQTMDLQFLCAGTTAIQIHIVVAPYTFQVRKISDHGDSLATECKIDKIFHVCVVMSVVMSPMNALPVMVPIPCDKLDAKAAFVPCKDNTIEIGKEVMEYSPIIASKLAINTCSNILSKSGYCYVWESL